MFPFLERFHAIAFVTSSHSHVRGKEQNHAKKGNILFAVAVHGSRTSVLKLPMILSMLLKCQSPLLTPFPLAIADIFILSCLHSNL